MTQKASYEQVAKYIIDQWLDRGVPLTQLIEAFLRADERACYEIAAQKAEQWGETELARDIRVMKPREFVFKNNSASIKDVPGWKP